MANDSANAPHAKRVTVASQRLVDPDNEGEIQLKVHQINRAHEIEAQHIWALEKEKERQPTAGLSKQGTSALNNVDEETTSDHCRTKKTRTKDITDNSTLDIPQPIPTTLHHGDGTDNNIIVNTAPSSHPIILDDMDSTPAAPSSLWENVLDEDGLVTANLLSGNSGADTEIDNMTEITLPKPLLAQQTRDLDSFFSPLYSDAGGKTYRNCQDCSKKLKRSAPFKSYESWCKKNSFLSMLPCDTKKCKQQKADADRQSQLDLHLREREKKETEGIAYSNELFRQAAVQWLIATNQPLSALEHPKFQDMIYVAAKATNGVKIPACKQTRQEIIDMFKHQMNHLRAKLNGPTVQGL
ncbi:hypothetical protein C0991_005410, partial [Blastosporella zonata]